MTLDSAQPLPQRTATLEEGEALAFTALVDGLPTPAFVVRVGGALVAFVDRCRHQSRSLDLGAGRVLQDGLLPCRHHGALYDPADGRCVAGPCLGARLTRLRLVARDGAWWCEGREGPTS